MFVWYATLLLFNSIILFVNKVKVGIIFGLIAIAIFALYIANPSTSRLWPKCLFKLITGFDCPICGLQRSLYAFLHRDFSHAIAYNYYLILALPYTFSCLVFTLLPQGKTKKRVKNIVISKPVLWFYAITFFAWLIIRNIYHL